jgi:hypothetical protein
LQAPGDNDQAIVGRRSLGKAWYSEKWILKMVQRFD